MHIRKIFIILFTCCVFTISCSTLKQYANDALNVVGLGSEKTPNEVKTKSGKTSHQNKRKPISKIPTQPTKDITPTENKTVPDSEENTEPTTVESTANNSDKSSDIIINKAEEQPLRQVEKKDLKIATKPQFRVEAPVDVQKRVGGAARLILADEDYIYMDFPQHFAVYDKNLTQLLRIPVAFPVKDIKRVERDDETFLYFKEDNDVMEIFKIAKTASEQGDSYSYTYVTGYQEFANFYWIDATTLLFILPEKIQVLDFSKCKDPEHKEVSVVSEILVSDVSDAFSLGKTVLLSRNGFLDVLDLAAAKVSSTVRVGRNFGFLGETEKDGQGEILLSLEDPKGVLKGVQYLSLNADRTGVTDFGRVVLLDTPLKEYSAFLADDLILGEDASTKPDQDGGNQNGGKDSHLIRLYSLNDKRILTGELATRTDLMAWSLHDGKIYLVTPLDISVNSLTLRPDIIHQSPQVKRLLAPGNQPVPLAQLGATRPVLDEYSLSPDKTVEFMTDARKVALLDENHFVVFENRPRENRQQLYTSSNFMQDEFQLAEPTVIAPTNYDKLLTTDYGLFAYSKARNQIFFMDVNLTSLAPMPIKIDGEFVSWTNFTSSVGEILVVSRKLNKSNATAKNVSATKAQQTGKSKVKLPVSTKPIPDADKDKTDETNKDDSDVIGEIQPITSTTSPSLELKDALYVVDFYLLKGPQEAELVSELPYLEMPFPLYSAGGDVIVITPSNIKTYNVQDPHNPSLNTLNTATFDTKFNFVSLKPLITNDNRVYSNRAYALIRDNDRYKIIAFSLVQPTERVVLEDFDITPDQFEGASFTNGGQLFILPTGEGTLFYDMTDFTKKSEDSRIAAHWPLPSEYVDVAKGARYICVALGPKGVYCGDLLFY